MIYYIDRSDGNTRYPAVIAGVHSADRRIVRVRFSDGNEMNVSIADLGDDQGGSELKRAYQLAIGGVVSTGRPREAPAPSQRQGFLERAAAVVMMLFYLGFFFAIPFMLAALERRGLIDLPFYEPAPLVVQQEEETVEVEVAPTAERRAISTPARPVIHASDPEPTVALGGPEWGPESGGGVPLPATPTPVVGERQVKRPERPETQHMSVPPPTATSAPTPEQLQPQQSSEAGG